MSPRILLTMGDASGIGPELIVKVAQNSYDAEISVVANSHQLKKLANALMKKILRREWL